MTGREVSPTVRHSIEDLAYYAPRFTQSGAALAQAQETAQGVLLGLGKFWGSSSPDQPFARPYPAAQYTLLILVKHIAAQLQGIGGGLRMMAKKYGITEHEITDQALTIGQGLSRENTLLAHTGGLPAPIEVSPDSLPTDLTSVPRHIPDPTPETRPRPAVVPLGRVTVDKVSAPRPQPGFRPDPDAWKQATARSLIGPWPSGDTSRMDEAGRAWDTLIEALDSAWNETQRYTAEVLANAEGPAADAFSGYVQQVIDPGKGTLALALESAQRIRRACINQAEAIRGLKQQLEYLVAELIVTLVVGQIFSMLVFEATQGMSDAIDAAIAAQITAMIVKFVGESTEDIATTVEGLRPMISLLSGSAVGIVRIAVPSGLTLQESNAVSDAFGEKPVEGSQELLSLLVSGLVGTFYGGFGASTDLMSNALADLADQGGPDSSMLARMSRQLYSNSMSMTAVNTALQQLMQSGRLSPSDVTSALFAARIENAVDGPRNARNH